MSSCKSSENILSSIAFSLSSALRSILLWWRRSRAGSVRLKEPFYAEIDAEEDGVLSAQCPRLHTGGAPEPNVTHTIEYIKQKIIERHHQTGKNQVLIRCGWVITLPCLLAGRSWFRYLLAGVSNFLPLVHLTSVPAGGLFVLYSMSQLAFPCRFGHSYCPSVPTADVFDGGGQGTPCICF